jgi:transposase
MGNDTLYVGLDTDKRFIDVAVAEEGREEPRYCGKVSNDGVAVGRLIKRLRGGGRRLEICYEAGPCGYGLYRRLQAMSGVKCEVIAPSLTPRRPGDRVKTNRRDALTLARQLRAGNLTAIWVPDPTHEAMRDLVRARAAAMGDLQRCRQRLSSFLLRNDLRYDGRSCWTKKHRAWLGQLPLKHEAHHRAVDEMLQALDEANARCQRLTADIAALLPDWSLAWLVDALQALRGFALINATTLASEIGDPRRFAKPSQLMAYLGLVPGEHSSGERVRRGGLTKAGNGRTRKALVEAAWTYARRPTAAAPASKHDPAIRLIAAKARQRLSRRFRRLTARGKRPTVAIAAVARELAGFVWAVAQAAGPAIPASPEQRQGRKVGI